MGTLNKATTNTATTATTETERGATKMANKTKQGKAVRKAGRRKGKGKAKGPTVAIKVPLTAVADNLDRESKRLYVEAQHFWHRSNHHPGSWNRDKDIKIGDRRLRQLHRLLAAAYAAYPSTYNDNLSCSIRGAEMRVEMLQADRRSIVV